MRVDCLDVWLGDRPTVQAVSSRPARDRTLAWSAPINALRPAAETVAGVGADSGAGESWCFEASVSARHPGIHLAQLELRSDDGAWLQMLEPAGGLQPGTRLRRALALNALHPLAV